MTRRRSIPPFQRGFSLAEILMATAIFAIVMIAALTIYDRSNKVFKAGTESADLQQSTRIGFDKLVSDLRMAGFDYNRGGTPNVTGQFPQPDEQIEYAGPNVVAFRANFNYQTAAAQGNGLEPDYTPKASGGLPIFPYVTTSNDEIVIYALKSSDTTKNTNSISFWADTSKPRSAYPPSGKETMVTVSGIDTTNANPPYTLYRFTVTSNSGTNSGVTAGTPVAENIRALHFFYYTDPKGTTLPQTGSPAANITTGHNADGSTFDTTYTVTLPDGSSKTYNTGAIGGDGQFDSANASTTNVVDRSFRALIQSVKVDLTGINANPDNEYVNPTETMASLKSYRQYQLQALIVPRNFGLTGFPEPSYIPPGPPTITGMCVSACAAPMICWAPPVTGGPVLQYRIEWDTQLNGAFSNSLIITDPTQTTVTLQDDGVMDPSRTWLYHIIALNDNGASQPSDLFSVQPKNATRPLPPSAFQATTALVPHAQNPANTDYAIKLQWTGPSANDPAKSGVTCTGSGCTQSGSAIPSQENILFRVARGLTSTFDPTKNEGVIILDTATKGQPGPLAPGSPVTWSDVAKQSSSSPGSLFAPGTCVQYYYRVEALDRCASSGTYNTSGSASDSVSDWSPAPSAAALGGEAYDAGSGVQAAAPPTVSVDTVNSLCPPIGTCSIILNWSAVTTNTAGVAIGVDKYRINRYRKIISDPSYTLDLTFGTNGNLDKSGFSQSNSGIGSYTDNPPAADSNGQPYYYQYFVTANDCRLGLVSAPAYYPSLCTVNPVIVEGGAQNGAASGDTPATAWIFNAGDTITVSPPVSGGITISNVKFEVFLYPSLTSVATYTAPASPFTYTWSDRTDNQIYYVKITVTSSTNCKEVHVKYVQDQPALGCSFASIAAPSASQSTPPGNTTTAIATMNITNGGTDPMVLNAQTYSLTFADPDGLHSDIKLISTSWQTSVNTFNDTLATAASPGTVTRPFATASPVLSVAANTTLTITVRWQYSKKDNGHGGVINLTGSPLTKLCIGYTISSETGVVKHCNVVGALAAGTTQNPTACD